MIAYLTSTQCIKQNPNGVDVIKYRQPYTLYKYQLHIHGIVGYKKRHEKCEIIQLRNLTALFITKQFEKKNMTHMNQRWLLKNSLIGICTFKMWLSST